MLSIQASRWPRIGRSIPHPRIPLHNEGSHSHARLRVCLDNITSLRLMLVTMTFNIGLYFTVVLGLSVGHAAFAGLAKRALTISRDEKAVNLSCC